MHNIFSSYAVIICFTVVFFFSAEMKPDITSLMRFSKMRSLCSMDREYLGCGVSLLFVGTCQANATVALVNILCQHPHTNFFKKKLLYILNYIVNRFYFKKKKDNIYFKSITSIVSVIHYSCVILYTSIRYFWLIL